MLCFGETPTTKFECDGERKEGAKANEQHENEYEKVIDSTGWCAWMLFGLF